MKLFNPKELPEWGQKSKEVVWLCEKNYAFRCDVCTAQTKQYKSFLQKEAERLFNPYTRNLK